MARFFRFLSLATMALVLPFAEHVKATDSASPVSIGPPGGWISALATTGAANQLWAASFSGKIFASADGAQNWHPSSLGVTDPVVTALAVSPNFALDKTVLAAADEGVFRSNDGGATWTLGEAGLDHHFCRALLLSPQFATDRTVFVATDNGVYRSRDAGSTWIAPSAPQGAVGSLAESVDTAGNVRLYAGMESGGLEQSTDNAMTWTTVGQFPAPRRALTITTLAEGRIVVGTDAGIWLSPDAGTSWKLAGEPNDRIDAFIADPQSPLTRLYAGSASGNGVFASADSGLSWTRMGAPDFPYVTALGIISGGQPATLVAGTAGGGVSLSTDGGRSWQAGNSGLNAFSVRSMRVQDGSTLVAGNGGLFIRDNQAGAWRGTALPSKFATSVDRSGKTLFAGTQDAGLVRSFDSGATWSRTSLEASSIESTALSPDGQTLIAAADYVYVSRDQGSTFQRARGIAGNDVRSFCFSPHFAADSTAFAATINHGLYVSSDGGLSWSPAGTTMPAFPAMQVVVSPRFGTDHAVYAATAGGGIFTSLDSGITWSAMSPQVPDAVVNALAWSPNGQLIAGTEHGAFVLDSAGWRNLFPGWDNYVSTLDYDLNGALARLFVGTTGHGVWEWDSPRSVFGTPTALYPTVTATPARVTGLAVPRVATSTPVAAAPTATRVPTTRGQVLRLTVVPFPAEAARQALLSVGGHSGVRVSVTLKAGRWARHFSASLDRTGRTGFGFVAPFSQISIVASARVNGTTIAAKLTVPVVKPHASAATASAPKILR